MSENLENKWLSVDDIAEQLQLTRRCAREKMREMADVVNLGSDKYQILRVSTKSFNAWLKNHRLVTL